MCPSDRCRQQSAFRMVMVGRKKVRASSASNFSDVMAGGAENSRAT